MEPLGFAQQNGLSTSLDAGGVRFGEPVKSHQRECAAVCAARKPTQFAAIGLNDGSGFRQQLCFRYVKPPSRCCPMFHPRSDFLADITPFAEADAVEFFERG